jgi:pyrroloquinoline quinone (PQQ) biosynthesis protein C
LEQHADEEDDHVPLWTEFGVALGLSQRELQSSPPNISTVELLKLGDQLSPWPIGVVLGWALEVQTPRVSVEKLRGLEAHYGIDTNNGGRYFEIHASRDLAHAAELELAIADLPTHQLRTAQPVAEEVTDRLWDLLSAVERAA